MEKLIPVIIDGVPTFNVSVKKTDLISYLSPLLEKYKNHNIEFIINSNMKIDSLLQRDLGPSTFETIWDQMNIPSIVVVSRKEERNKTTDLYKLPKDVLVKLISTIAEETGIYYVVSVYYKYGEYDIREFPNKEKLIKYLIEYLIEDGSEKQEIYKNYTLEQLIEVAKSEGERQISKQRGYGIVAVFKGQML
jgi:hypothetical protein